MRCSIKRSRPAAHRCAIIARPTANSAISSIHSRSMRARVKNGRGRAAAASCGGSPRMGARRSGARSAKSDLQQQRVYSIMTGNWRDRAATTFVCQKQPASGSRGMVVSNHPLASAAGAEMLAAGGNAIDAAIATLFALTVVEPMMVGIIGGGMAHMRLADGSHRFIDGQSTVPLAVRPDSYRSKPGSAHDVFDTVDDENLIGPKAVAVPGSLKAWCETLQRFGTMPLADVMQPAIRHASRGYLATPYLHECIVDGAGEMRKDNAISAIYLPNGTPLSAGNRVVQSEYAETLSYISRHGEAALYHGPLGDILV